MAGCSASPTPAAAHRATPSAADPYQGYWRLGDNPIAGSTWPAAPTATSFWGQLEEVGVWSRALAPAENLHPYRRGANRVALGVRACNQADCGDGPLGIGADGSPGLGFSERLNRLGATVLPTATAVNWGALSPPVAPLPGRYAQLRGCRSPPTTPRPWAAPPPGLPDLAGASLRASLVPCQGGSLIFRPPQSPATPASVQEVDGGSARAMEPTAAISADEFHWYGLAAGQPAAAAWTTASLLVFRRQAGAIDPLWVRLLLRSDGVGTCSLEGLSVSGGA